MTREYGETKTRFSKPSRPTLEIITGTVSKVNVNSYTVTVVSGEDKVYKNIPILNVYGTYFNQDITWLKSMLGTTVCLVWLMDRYYVLAVMPIEHAPGEEQLGYEVTDGECGGQDKDSYGSFGGKNFKGRRANDFYDSDKIIRAESGGELSLLREGVARLKAGPLAQFILGRFKEFGKLVTRVFKHFTDFGEVEHYHTDEGRVGLHVKGGASYKEETHPDAAKWTVQAWVGDDPDNEDSRLHIKVNDPNQVEYVELTMDINGDFTLETSNDDIQLIGNNRNHSVDGDSEETIGGDYKISVGGNASISVDGDVDIEAGGNINIEAGGDVNVTSDSAVNVEAPEINLN